MKRTLPKIKSQKQKLIIGACQDYFGRGQNPMRANQVALWAMNRRRRVELSEEEKRDLELIKINLGDEVYVNGLLASGQ